MLEKLTVDEDMSNWINSIPKEKWAKSFDGGRRFGHMTTNLSECINGVLKGGRNLPITALVQMTFFKLVEYFVCRSRKVHEQVTSGQVYTDDLVKSMTANNLVASSHQVRDYNRESTRFDIQEARHPITQAGGRRFTLNLNEGWCDCGDYQALHYPCSHVISACAALAINPMEYVHPVYKLENIVKAYQGQWYPVKDEPFWPPAPAITLVADPALLRARGRPKSTRIRNEMDWIESGPRQRCRLCGEEGHNRRSCPSRRSRTSGEGPSS